MITDTHFISRRKDGTIARGDVMNQAEKREFLIRRLLDEDRRYGGMEIPVDTYEQKRMLRSLMNIRRPMAIGPDFLTVQDEYLRQEIEEAGVTSLADLEPVCGDLYLWQGDITRLRCGAIVNAANSGMTGCYVPCHACIDNCIHTFAGIQLRLDCAELMDQQGHEEPTGQAKITRAYNLPCDYVLHGATKIFTINRVEMDKGKPQLPVGSCAFNFGAVCCALMQTSRSLYLSLQINHIDQLNAAFNDRVVIVIHKKVFHDMRANKSAFFVKRNCQGAISRSDLNKRVLSFIFRCQKINQRFSISFPLKFRDCSNILDFKNTVSLVSNNALAFHAVISQHIHRASFNVSFHHVFLFVRQ